MKLASNSDIKEYSKFISETVESSKNSNFRADICLQAIFAILVNIALRLPEPKKEGDDAKD